MNLYRLCITLIMFLGTNVLLGQRKETISVSFDEIKDMPQKSLQHILNLSILQRVCTIL